MFRKLIVNSMLVKQVNCICFVDVFFEYNVALYVYNEPVQVGDYLQQNKNSQTVFDVRYLFDTGCFSDHKFDYYKFHSCVFISGEFVLAFDEFIIDRKQTTYIHCFYSSLRFFRFNNFEYNKINFEVFIFSNLKNI